MADNKTIIQKADMALSDLATAGRLNPEQTDRFIRKVLDEPTLLNRSRAVAMRAPEMKINKIGFGSRILRPATSGQPLAEDKRVKPDLGQVKLTTDEVIAEIHLPYDVLEDNIEGGNVQVAAGQNPGGIHQTIVDLMAQRAAVDLEELALLGDTAKKGSDEYLGLTDGWLKRADANVVNASSAIDKGIFKQVVKATPDKYLRNRANMIHFVSVDNETELRDKYADRSTTLGDSHLQGNLPLYVFGSQVMGASMMPTENALFTNPLNLIFGIHRNIMIEYDKDIRSRVFIIVLTARIGFQIEETEAITKVTGITA